jgi:uncharacterized protein (UPF0264 family)
MGRLLVSVRGPEEAISAAKGGAHIADVEHPGSALGTPYPLNIKAVRNKLNREGFKNIPISTNIGEEQANRGTACQAALGVAIAGSNYVKFGLAGLNLKAAAYLGRSIVRSVKEWCPKAKLYPAVFPDEEFSISLNPLKEGPKLVKRIKADGLLIDTYNKNIGKGLLDYYNINQLTQLVTDLHAIGKEAWLAGSISEEQLKKVWKTGVDVICIREAACKKMVGEGRFGKVSKIIVNKLVKTIKA